MKASHIAKLKIAAIRSAGRKGFAKTREGFEGKSGIKSPTLLAGWLKGQARKKGMLAKEHAYGRRGK